MTATMLPQFNPNATASLNTVIPHLLIPQLLKAKSTTSSKRSSVNINLNSDSVRIPQPLRSTPLAPLPLHSNPQAAPPRLVLSNLRCARPNANHRPLQLGTTLTPVNLMHTLPKPFPIPTLAPKRTPQAPPPTTTRSDNDTPLCAKNSSRKRVNGSSN